MTIIVTPITTFSIEVKRHNQTLTMSLTPQQAVFVWSCISGADDAHPGWQNLITPHFTLEVFVPFPNECCSIIPMIILLEDYENEINQSIHLISGQEIEDLRVAIGHAMRE
jgi:hypothetical protein